LSTLVNFFPEVENLMVATVGIKDYGDKDNLVLNLWISI
jgi:hypothetical protein